MRLLLAVILSAAEVVLSGKLGVTERSELMNTKNKRE
jgi:hypothetical protein